MINWNNLDTLPAFEKLENTRRVELAKAMSGEAGAKRVTGYAAPMGGGLNFYYGARPVNEEILSVLQELADQARLTQKFAMLYNGDVINTGENRRVLHHLCRGQLGKAVIADGVDKREFYLSQQEKIADLARRVHNGELTNAAGEPFTTVVQIGIGGSDLGPRAIYLALENWAKVNGLLRMKAEFISNVDPDDAAAVLGRIDIAYTLFILVSKSGVSCLPAVGRNFSAP